MAFSPIKHDLIFKNKIRQVELEKNSAHRFKLFGAGCFLVK